MELSSALHECPADEPRPTASASASSFLDSAALLSGFMAPGTREVRPPRFRKPLELAWSDFLSPYPWQWFATFTFADAIHPEAAGKRFSHWTKLLDEHNGFRHRTVSTHKRRCVWVRGLEYQRRDVIHFHALIGNLPPLDCVADRFAWSARWQHMGDTGFASIHPVIEVGGVAGYIAKYCSKGGEVDVSPNLRRAVESDSFANI